MFMKKDFGGVIWTKHALARMRNRGIKQGDAWVTWKRPDQSRKANTKGTWVYYRTLDNQKIEVVAKQNEKKEWVILSVWSRIIRKNLKDKSRKKTGGENVLSKALNFLLNK